MKVFRLFAAFVAAVLCMVLGQVSQAQSEYDTETPLIHVTHSSTDSVYWTDTTHWYLVPNTGCTGTVKGTLYIQYIDPSTGGVMATSSVHGYNDPNNGSTLPPGSSTWNTTSATYSPIDYYNGYINAYKATHGMNSPPSGTYTYRYKLATIAWISDPDYGDLLDISYTIYQNETFIIVH